MSTRMMGSDGNEHYVIPGQQNSTDTYLTAPGGASIPPGGKIPRVDAEGWPSSFSNASGESIAWQTSSGPDAVPVSPTGRYGVAPGDWHPTPVRVAKPFGGPYDMKAIRGVRPTYEPRHWGMRIFGVLFLMLLLLGEGEHLANRRMSFSDWFFRLGDAGAHQISELAVKTAGPDNAITLFIRKYERAPAKATSPMVPLKEGGSRSKRVAPQKIER